MVVLLILIIAILIFGIGGVIEGLLWAFIIGAVLALAAGFFGWRQLTSRR